MAFLMVPALHAATLLGQSSPSILKAYLIWACVTGFFCWQIMLGHYLLRVALGVQDDHDAGSSTGQP